MQNGAQRGDMFPGTGLSPREIWEEEDDDDDSDLDDTADFQKAMIGLTGLSVRW